MTTAELKSQEAGTKALIAAKVTEIGKFDAQSQADAQAVIALLDQLHAIQDQLVESTATDLANQKFIDLTKKQSDASMGTSAR